MGPSTSTGAAPSPKEFGDGSVELGALVEQDGVGGVEVLRSAPVVVGEVGVAAGDEPEDLVFVGDGEDGAVAEAVDQGPGAGAGGQAGLEELVVGDAAPTQVVDQGGPGCRGVAGGDVGTGPPAGQSVVEVGAGPAGVDAGGVEVHGHGVDVGHACRVGDGVVPRRGAVEHPLDLGVGGFQHAHALPVQGGGGEVGGHVIRDGVMVRSTCPAAWLPGSSWSHWSGVGASTSVTPVGGPPRLGIRGHLSVDVIWRGGVVFVLGRATRGGRPGPTGATPWPGTRRRRRPGRSDPAMSTTLSRALAAGEGVVDDGDQRRPPRAVLQVCGPVGPEACAELGGPGGGEVVPVVDPVGDGGGEVAADPPPQRGGGVVVGQGTLGDRCSQEVGGRSGRRGRSRRAARPAPG